MEDTGKSEVARILQQIETEYQAAYSGLSEYAVVAPHRKRSIQTERIGKLHQSLQQIVGKNEAIQFIAQTLEHL